MKTNFFGNIFKNKKKWIIFGIICAFIAIFILTLICFRKEVVNILVKGLTINNFAESADVIVVMGGSLERRVPFGIALYKKGVAKKIIFVSGLDNKWKRNSREKYGVPSLDEENIVIIAQKSGLKDDDFEVLKNSLSTLDDAKKIYEYYGKHKFKSAIIITDSLHSRRTMLCINSIFKKSDVKFYSNPIFIENETEYYAEKHDYFVYIANEYLKLLVHIILGK